MKNLISRRNFLKATGLSVLAAGTASALTGCSSDKTDWETVQDNGYLTVGMTIFEPMNYYENDVLVGYDTELTQAVCAILGVEAVFQEIEWDNKVIELNGYSIDCIWNGMTKTDELAENIDFSTPYSGNMQVCVINSANADLYTDLASINAAGVIVGAEAGSAGESVVESDIAAADLVSVAAQRDCLLELKSGTMDVGVMDYVMAAASIGDGTSYTDLMIVPDLELSKEEYAIGFRKGSDLTDLVNDALQQLVDDGTVAALVEKYPTVMSML
ncbi:MAG: substrate-binding domain-containing protein [Faecalibacterium sp.]